MTLFAPPQRVETEVFAEVPARGEQRLYHRFGQGSILTARVPTAGRALFSHS